MPENLTQTASKVEPSQSHGFDFLSSTVFLRDEFVPFADANLSIASSPVLYGLSVYTVFSIKWDEHTKKVYIFRLKDHFERLVASAKILDFHSFIDEWTFERFESTIQELVRKNEIREDVLLRVTVFLDEISAGTRMHGLKNSVSAYIYPMGEILKRGGVHACVSSWQRTSDNAIPSRAKVNGSYVNASLMKNEALLNGYDEAIAIDQDGHICEGTIANIFLVKNGGLITPDSQSDILEGITRNTVMKIAKELNLPVEERVVDRSELYIADEVFFSGSSANITPVLSIDKRPISSQIGPITKPISDMYEQIRNGQIERLSGWLTEVNQL